MSNPRDRYLTHERLAGHLREYRRDGAASNAFAADLLVMAGGIWDRFHFTADRDDFCQDAVFHVLGHSLKKAKLTGNLFWFLSTCICNFGRNQRDRANAERRRFQKYAEHHSEIGGFVELVPSSKDNQCACSD